MAAHQLSDQDRLEQQANRLDLVSRWADDLAHEIKNPLHAMVINLELVKRRASDANPAPLIERTEVVESELHRVHGLVDSLLKLVRPWPDVKTATVQQVFDALHPVFQARARIRQVTYAHEAGSAIVVMSPGDLAQVVVNLVDNAIDVTPEGGKVSTAVTRADGEARITVRDGGPGLRLDPDAERNRSAAREGHTGAGLLVSQRLVAAAGGTLHLTPVDGGGSEAIVTVPCTGSA